MKLFNEYMSMRKDKEMKTKETKYLIKEYDYYLGVLEMIVDVFIDKMINGELFTIKCENNKKAEIETVVYDKNVNFNNQYDEIENARLSPRRLYIVREIDENKKNTSSSSVTEESVRKIIKSAIEHKYKITSEIRYDVNDNEYKALNKTLRYIKSLEEIDYVKIRFWCSSKVYQTVLIERTCDDRFTVNKNDDPYSEKDLKVLLLYIMKQTCGKCVISHIKVQKTVIRVENTH